MERPYERHPFRDGGFKWVFQLRRAFFVAYRYSYGRDGALVFRDAGSFVSAGPGDGLHVVGLRFL